MPTGYTAPLHDGDPITFNQFVLRCSRAMGAAIMQRDESLDVDIVLREVGDYTLNSVDKSGTALGEAWARTDEEWAALQATAIAEADKYRVDYLAKREAISERYEEMLAAVREWEPPTPDHSELKKFMVEQLEESIRFDVGDWIPDIPEELPVVEYREREVGRLARALERDTQLLAKERERVRGQNAWVVALYDSLGISTATPVSE